MSELKSAIFSVNIAPPVTAFYPLEGRKYTLAQSEYTENLYLSIHNQYSIAPTSKSITEILEAEWVTRLGEYTLKGKISMHGSDNDIRLTKVRYMIFQKELPELIRFLVTADSQFLRNYPLLLDAPIIIQFDTPFPEFSGSFHLGTSRQYLLKAVVT